MILLYTNAPSKGAQQADPEKSLGGIASSTIIPNAYIGNIFSEASSQAIQLLKREVKLIALRNTTQTTANNIQIVIGIPDDTIADYKIAFTTVHGDPLLECFESIPNSSALPYYATFTAIHNTDIISVSPSSLDPNKLIGIWLMRILKPAITKSCAQYALDYITPPTPLSIEEDITLSISWT